MQVLKHITLEKDTNIILSSLDKQSQEYHSLKACQDLSPFESQHHARQVEIIASHLLITKLTGLEEYPSYTKDEYGKPHIRSKDLHISISHTDDMACAIRSSSPVGIDIQSHTQKLSRIKEKFIEEDALSTIPQDHFEEILHVVWGAKESMYKAYGKKQLRFKTNLIVEPFDYQEKWGKTLGWVIKNGEKERYSIYYEKIDNNYLVFAIADPKL